MAWEDSEALESYLRSIEESRGLPSPKETACLERIALWEGLMVFCEDMEKCGGGGMLTAPTAVVDCPGYDLELTPWACLENQLSPMCLPGFPCEDCEMAVGVVMKGQEFYCANQKVSMTTGLCDAARLEAQRRSLVWPEGRGWLRICLECSMEATEITPMRPLARVGEFGSGVGEGASGSTRSGAPNPQGSGTPSLKPAKTRKVKAGYYDPKTMSRAVARDLGLI